MNISFPGKFNFKILYVKKPSKFIRMSIVKTHFIIC